MQDPKPSTLNERGRKSRSRSKRKLSQQTPITAESHSSHKTIAELFGGPTKLLQRPDSSIHGLSRSAKRVKLEHPCASTTSTTEAIQVLPPEKMYNFTSSVTRTNNDVIDLTTSSNGSPSKTPLVLKKPHGIVRPTNFTPHTGAKRLVVKNLRKTPRSSLEQYLDQTWEQLNAALDAIFNDQKVPNSFEELYKGVENLCKQDKAPEIYSRLKERCKQYVSGKLKEPLVTRARNGEDVDVLRAVVGAWSTWNAHLVVVPEFTIHVSRNLTVGRQQYAPSSTTWTGRTSFTP